MNLKRKLRGYCVYFGPGPLSDSGKKTYLAPVELRCHWEDSQEQRLDASGNVWMSKASVMLEVPVPKLGALWHGKLIELVSQTKPFDNPNASEVRMVDEVPNRKDDQKLYTAYL